MRAKYSDLFGEGVADVFRENAAEIFAKHKLEDVTRKMNGEGRTVNLWDSTIKKYHYHNLYDGTQATYDPSTDIVTLPNGSQVPADQWLGGHTTVGVGYAGQTQAAGQGVMGGSGNAGDMPTYGHSAPTPSWDPYNSAKPGKEATGCAAGFHTFKAYHGLTDSFDYCTKCDLKRPISNE